MQYMQLRLKVHQRETCAFLEGWAYDLGFFSYICLFLSFDASKLQELHFFLSPVCRILKSSGSVRFL